jgi:hypothetical protein
MEFLVFEILAIPCIFLKVSFNALRNLWTIIMIALLAVSIKFNKNNFKYIFQKNVLKVMEMPKFLSIVFLVLLFFQCYVGFAYMHEDYDDSNFVAKATIARDTNTLFVYDDAGNLYDEFPARHVFSPFPCFTASISTVIDTHPAIVAHTIFPVVFLVVGYMIYYLISKSLFKNNRKKSMVFMIILSVLYIFGNYTRYSPFVRLLSRAWQGKSLVVNIILPFILYLFLEFLGEEKDRFAWILLFITIWAGDLLSSMAIFLPIIECAILVFLYVIKDKNPRYILKFIPCCLPNIIYGIMSLMIR